jgi:hypothetical protein
MTDILGEALQKITTPENAPLAEQPHVAMPVTSAIVPAAQPAVAQPAMVEESSTATPAKIVEQNRVMDSSATRRSSLQYIQEHRRQAAAIIIAACVAVFWFDNGSDSVNTSSADSDSAQADAAEEELMLDEFDAIEVTPQREPAEPVEVAATDPFPLTIPQMEADAPQVVSQSSEHPLLQQSIGDVRNQSVVQAESVGSLGIPAQQSSDNSPPSIPRSVRFTGRIQPLN